jgi:phage terminase large subunit-like protein
MPDDSAGIDRWMSDAEWSVAADDTIGLEALVAKSSAIWLGIDAGSLDDLSAAVVLGKTSAGQYLVWSHQWISRRGYEKRRHANPYDTWIESGDLTRFEGGGGDIAGFIELANYLAATGKLQLIGIDSYGATELGQAFADCGVEVQGVPQGWKLTPALIWVERRLAEGKLKHHDSPVLNWNIHNATIVRSGNSLSISFLL